MLHVLLGSRVSRAVLLGRRQRRDFVLVLTIASTIPTLLILLGWLILLWLLWKAERLALLVEMLTASKFSLLTRLRNGKNKGDNMPRATVNADGTRIDLKTCAGGFVL